MKQYQFKISNRFATLKNFTDSKDINWAWENITETIKVLAKENLGVRMEAA
jgi:hypothetical protein